MPGIGSQDVQNFCINDKYFIIEELSTEHFQVQRLETLFFTLWDSLLVGQASTVVSQSTDGRGCQKNLTQI